MTSGLHIERRFTADGQDPYDTVEWSRRDSRITNPDGSIVFEMKDAEVPAQWSQVAADIMVSKYFRKAGVPQVDAAGNPVLDDTGAPVTGPEQSARQVVKRLASTWRWWGETNDYFATGEDAQAFEDELAYMLLHQMAAPNSPQWFNTGLAHQYGITGTPQGFWYVDPATEEAVPSPDSYTRPAPHACFPAGTRITTRGGFLPIEKIEPGDEVLTHEGRYRKVQRTMQRQVDEDLVELHIRKLTATPLVATANHPVWAIRKEDLTAAPSWIPAGDLRSGDYVVVGADDDASVTPDESDLAAGLSTNYVVGDTAIVTRNSGHAPSLHRFLEWSDPEIWRLVGRWIGDGTVLHESRDGARSGIGFVFDAADAEGIEDIRRLMDKFFGVDAPVEFANGQRTASLRYVRRPLGQFFGDAFGEGFAGKHLPQSAFELPRQHKLELLTGLFQSDGCEHRVRDYRGLNFDFSNRDLAEGVWRIARSLGYSPSITGGTVRPGGTTPHYRVQISANDAPELAVRCSISVPAGSFRSPIRRHGRLVAYRIAAVKQAPFYGTVYNFQTDEDESYVASGVVVHNCFINSVDDDLVNEGGIMDLWVREARLFKMGSGCTSGDSRVYVAGQGFVPIRDLYAQFASEGRPVHEFDGRGRYIDIGDTDVFTLSVDDATGEYTQDKIELVWAYDVDADDKVTVAFDTGARATVSAWHPFLVWDGERVVERRADELGRGDSVIGPNQTAADSLATEPIILDYETTYYRRTQQHSVLVDTDVAWLVGYFMGDGSLGRMRSTTTNSYGKSYEYDRLRLRFHDETTDTLERVQRIVSRVFGETAAIQADGRGSRGQHVSYTGRKVTAFFASLFEPGTKTYTLAMPRFVWLAGREAALGFLAGLIDSDGAVANGRAAYTTASHRFADEVATLASVYGLGGGVVRHGSVSTTAVVRRSTSFDKRLEFAGYLSHPSRRTALLDEGVRHERSRCMPLSEGLATELFGEHAPADWLKVLVGEETFHLGRLRYEGIVNPTKLEKALATMEPGTLTAKLGRIAESLAFVTSVEACTDDPDFYDLTVARHSNYLAGEHGLVAIHNTGSNFSRIRAEGEQLSGGGKSSGLMSFLKVGDRAAGAIKSGGTTRRAAKMVILDVDHPDIETFINWKADEEDKVRALVAAGYSSDFNGEAYATVSGQNSNNSVRLSNEFIQAVLDDGEWDLTARTDGRVMKTVKARDLWKQVAEAAWKCADPGVQFDTTIQEWHTSPAGGKINATNPCSEYVFLDNTACNLASLNLVQFERADGSFDLEAYRHAIRIWTIVLEISVTMAHFPSKAIAEGSYDYRTLGLGYANLGSLLMRAGIAYDSDLGRSIAGALTAILTGYSYATSAEMAEAVGPFRRFAENRDSMLRVMRNHRRAAYGAAQDQYDAVSHYVVGIDQELCPPDILAEAHRAWDSAVELGEEHGYRNAQTTVLAPTGCLVGGSLIPTSRGLVRLRSLGDPAGAQWQDLGIQVGTDEGARTGTQFYVNGVEPVVTVDTHRGYRIQGTPTHRIKVVEADGSWVWKRFGDIAAGDKVPLQLDQLVGEPQQVELPPRPEAHWTSDFATVVPRTMSPELAEFVGYFMGDGSLHAKGIRLCVSREDFDVVDRLSLLGKELFGLEAHVNEIGGYTEVAFHSVPLVLWWEACGFAKTPPSENHSGKGYHPHIPDAVLHSNDRAVYAGFLRGLFEADGTVHLGYPSWSTTSLEFSRDVQSLLLALGHVTTRKIDRTGWGDSDLAVLRLLNLSAAGRWADEIGFIGGRKQSAVAGGEHSQASRDDHIPVTRATVDRLAPENDNLRKTMLLALSRIGSVSRRSAEELLARTGDAELRHLLGFFYDEVTSAELGEEQYTFDLSVPDNVTYVANGFVSHNTIGLLMDCDTTGVEPDFALVKFKKLAGGGYFKIANQSIAPALERLGYTRDQVSQIIDYVVGTMTLNRSPRINTATLIAKGFTADDIDKIEAVLPGVFELGFAFNQWTLGEETMRRLGFTSEQYNAPGFTMLKALGFSDEDVRLANDHICGRQTIEGAPHLRDEHLPVFDTANRNGRLGERFIHHTGHIRMMAAAQPFISGAISKCVTGETLLATADGLVRIRDLHQGEAPDSFRDEIIEVASLGGTQKTDAFYYGGEREVRTVVLRSGHKVTGTPNHRLLVARDGDLVWRRLDQIEPGEHVATHYGADMWSTLPARFDGFVASAPYGSQKAVRIPVGMTDELAFLLGAYVAEGHTTRQNWTVTITNADEAVLGRVAAAWRSEFGVEARITRHDGRCPGVVVASKTIVEFLDHLGCGERASSKRIPDAVLRSPRSMVLSFLQGLYLDGYVTTGPAAKMAICVDSPALLDDLQAILTNLGVVHSRVTKHNTEYDKDFDEVYAAGGAAQALARLVPFAEAGKRARQRELLARDFAQSTADIVPGIDPKALYEMIPAGKSGRNGWGERSRFSFLLDPRTRHVSRRTLERVAVLPMVDLPEWLRTVLDDGLHFSPVESVRDAGTREVYDVSVPTNHAFVGNGIVNHNTINMPNEVTVEDIEESYHMSWELGLKAMALYRDGSKASQPLSAKTDDGDTTEDETDGLEDALAEERELVLTGRPTVHAGLFAPGVSPTAAYADMPRPRFLLPARRSGYTQEARVGGHKLFMRTGEYQDGTLGELFLDLAKEGATLRGILSCFAIAVSKGLQYGVPLEEYVDTFTFQTFEPRGMVEGHPNIKMANSIVDYVFRALGVEYLQRDELAQVPPDRSMELPEPRKGLALDAGVQLDLTDAAIESDIDAQVAAAAFVDADDDDPGGDGVARALGLGSGAAAEPAAVVTGSGSTVSTARSATEVQTAAVQAVLADKMGDAPLCDTCGHITVRNGSCYRCLNCGDSKGCS